MILDVTLYKKSVRKPQKLLCNDKSRNNQKTVKEINSQMIYLTLQEVSVGIGRPRESMIPEANRSFHVHVILSHHGQPQVVQTNPKLERNLINTHMTYLTLQEASAGIDLWIQMIQKRPGHDDVVIRTRAYSRPDRTSFSLFASLVLSQRRNFRGILSARKTHNYRGRSSYHHTNNNTPSTGPEKWSRPQTDQETIKHDGKWGT